jgi:transcriptional regulator with XRE-family HTH domain
MDPVRLGLAVRALRRRRGWTQLRLAEAAGMSQAAVSRCERGEADALTCATLRDIADALGARLTVTITWHGEDLDRLLDAAHADIVEAVVRLLRAAGWEVVPEATFSVYGERGSIDVLAWNPVTGALLVIEVKSVVPDMQAMLSTLDRKVRHAPAIAKARGWSVASVSRVLVLPDDRTARRRIESHATTIDQVMPLRTVAVRRWLADPVGAIGGVLFLPMPGRTTARHRVGRPRGS